MTEPDYVEYMRALTEDYLPNVTEHLVDLPMAELFWRVNLLRRATKDAVFTLIDLEQSVTK